MLIIGEYTMNRLHLLSMGLLFFISLMPNITIANEKFYVSGQVGLATPHGRVKSLSIIDDEISTMNKLKNSPVYNISVGKKVYNEIFTELEYFHTNHKLKKVSLEYDGTVNKNILTKTNIVTNGAFLNVNYRHKMVNIPFIPYLSIGAGFSHNKKHNITYAETFDIILKNNTTPGKITRNFAWQLGAGVLIPLTKNLSINVSYKYRDLGKIRSSNIINLANGKRVEDANPMISGRLRTSNTLFGVLVQF